MFAVWDEKYWFPRNISWDYISQINENGIPPTLSNATDCLYAVLILTLIRQFLKNAIFTRIGIYMGLSLPKQKFVYKVAVLEQTYRRNRRPPSSVIHDLAISLRVDDKTVENWFRRRRNQDKSPVLVKFVESAWKFTYYSSMFAYGVYVLHDKPYLWDVRETMLNYPNFIMPAEIHWYYMIQMGFYTASLCWIFYEVKRSDFKVMMGHHVATVCLLLFSYITNHHRVGAVVLIVHDIADCWMEAAKMCKYVKEHTLAEWLFGIFVFVWLITRLVYFPFWVIHTTYYFGFLVYGRYFANYVMVGFLIVLQILHIYWFYLILKIIAQLKFLGSQLTKDCRSESELSDPINGNNEPDICLTTRLEGKPKSHIKTQLSNVLTEVNGHDDLTNGNCIHHTGNMNDKWVIHRSRANC